MALSKSLQMGQVSALCQLCEESNEIKWKCLQCEFLLCTKCQKLHRKVKSSDHHTIIDIKDIALYQQQAKEAQFSSNFICAIHKGQNCCLFCLTCEEVVCPLCIAKTHNEHKMTELSEGNKLIIDSMKTKKSGFEKKLKEIAEVLTTLESIRSSEGSKYEKEKLKIINQEKVLKVEIEMLTKKVLNELGQKQNELVKSVKDEENRFQRIFKDIEIRNKKMNEALGSGNVHELLRTYKEETKNTKPEQINQIVTHFQRLPVYVPGSITNLESFYGQLMQTRDDYEEKKIEVIKQYKTQLDIIENIVCCEDGSIWIHQHDRVIYQTKISNGLLHIIKTVQQASFNMAALSSGDLLLSTWESYLAILSHKTGCVTITKYSIEPLQTVAVHVTKEKRIIVGARERGETFPVKGPRVIIVMNSKGERKNQYQFDKKGNKLFTVPFRITTDFNDNIYIIDHLREKDWSGRIVALDHKGGVRWIYTGHSEINKEQLFQPRNFVTTKLNNILVTDQDHHTIHILNNEGECIHYIHTTGLEIHFPNAINIDNRDFLYIGCKRYSDKKGTTDAPIYVTKFTGF